MSDHCSQAVPTSLCDRLAVDREGLLSCPLPAEHSGTRETPLAQRAAEFRIGQDAHQCLREGVLFRFDQDSSFSDNFWQARAASRDDRRTTGHRFER